MRHCFLALCVALAAMAGEVQPWKDSVTIGGGGQSSVKSGVMSLESGASYRLDFRMRKTGAVQENKACLSLWGNVAGCLRQLAVFADSVPVDGEEHVCASAFALPKDATGECYLLLNDEQGGCQVMVRDVHLRKLSPAPPVTIGPAEVTVKATDAQEEDCPSVIQVNLGEDGVATLLGNEAFAYRKIGLRLAPATAYRFTLEMRKEGELSPNPIEHRGVTMVDLGANRVIEYGHLGEKLPVDGKWHAIDSTISTPSLKGAHFFCLYNCHAKGTLQIRNFTVTKCNATTPWGSEVFSLTGNGKFQGRNFPFAVKAGQPCRIAFRMRKVAPLAVETMYHRGVVAWRGDNGALHEILWLGENIPIDGQWHDVEGKVTFPPASQGNGLFFLYNCHATGTVEIRDWLVQGQ
ncbi:MAG: hypothetical protein IJJ33_12800 [Victivallales bacterium]|nr:hypothetical protein [Victivallales bacterium]